MTDLRLEQLRSFIAVADALHFGRAARLLGLGQSAVSQHVRRLEQEVGVELLTRTSRSVELTPAGQCFLDGVRTIVRDSDRTIARTRAAAAGECGLLRIAAQQSARALILPGILARLAERLPNLTVDVLSTTSAEGIAAVVSGAADAALVRDSDPVEGLAVERLSTDPIMIALPAGHRLAARGQLRFSDLRGERWIGWDRTGAPEHFDRIIALMRDDGLDTEPAIKLRGVDTRLGAVAAGLGFGLESGAYAWLFSERVRFIPIVGQPLCGATVAVWPSVSTPPGVPHFLTAAREVAAQLDPGGALA